MEEQPIIKISVRNLVEFILREGDIDNRTAAGPNEKEAMQMGSRIHRRIQRRMGSEYRAEVPLKTQIPCDGFLLQVEGRADGIMEEDDGTVIDEIKGVLCELDTLKEPVGVHLAQAKCYACIYAGKQELKQIGVQMTYCQMETEELKRFREVYTYEELNVWFSDLVGRYEKWARFQVEWKVQRNASIKEIEFPYDYREGQREVVTSVYKTILRKKKLFIQAPTGVGKTMATVFPAVKAVGEGLGEKIFYLTAKTITRTVAEQAFLTLKEQALKYKVITLTAKEKICFCEKTECNPDACPYAKGHYDRVNDAVYEFITGFDNLSREALEEQASKHQVCPFEMSLDVSLWADAVICDYNYVFDPNAHLKRFFTEGGSGDYLFLVDEAHNLVDRAREMYSAAVYKEDMLKIKKLVKEEAPKLAKRLEECNKQMLELKRECETYEVIESISHISIKLMNIFTELERFMEECGNPEMREEVLDFYFSVRDFLNIYDKVDENYLIYTEIEPDGRFKLKLFCVNPAANLEEYLGCGNSTIYFSATFLPIGYYRKLLSMDKEDYAIYAKSSFRTENRLLIMGRDVSTKYTLRGDEMYERYARYIMTCVEQRKGNYLIFFPSYQFMESVYEKFLAVRAGKEGLDCLIQEQNMNEEKREEFLGAFEEENDRSLVGFCVLGGIFAEGIDLTRDRLIGALIIGTGLPQVCNEREMLKQYFDRHEMPGFDYAYLYPGMNKVLQAAGRVIRTEEDRGIIGLLDDRFLNRQYREVFPREWDSYEVCNVGNIGEKITGFWNRETGR